MNLGLTLSLAVGHGRRDLLPPQFVAAATANSASGTDLTVNAPAGAEIGDQLVAVVQATGTDTFITPSGWTLANTAISAAVYHRTHDGSASYDFSTAASGAKGAVMLAYRNVTFGVCAAWNAGVAASPTPGTITVPVDNSINFALAGSNIAGVGYTMPAGWTQRAVVTQNRSLALFERDDAVASGSLAGVTLTRVGASGSARAIQFTLSPA